LPTTTIPVKEKRSLSPVEIKQEFGSEGDENTGERKLRSEGREGRKGKEGNDTDSKSQEVSQPDQAMDVDDTVSQVHSDITAYDHDGHCDTDNVLDHEAMEIEIAQAKSEVARIDKKIATMDAQIARNDGIIARNDVAIARKDAEIARKDAEILVMVRENTRRSGENADLSGENETMSGQCAEMVGRNATMQMRNAIMGTILHIAKGDDTLVAMSKVGLGKARLTAKQLVQVR
jgi:hypothetical protein